MMLKKIIATAAMMTILGSSLSVNAAEKNTYSPETGELPYQGLQLEITPPNARGQSNYSSSAFRNYSETSAVYKLSGTQSIKNGHQKTKTATASTGVQYQILTSGNTKLKYVTRTGVYNGNLKIDLSNSSAAGTRRKLRLANYYNLSFNDTNAPVQSASGTFVY